jgi:hypothetical protein
MDKTKLEELYYELGAYDEIVNMLERNDDLPLFLDRIEDLFLEYKRNKTRVDNEVKNIKSKIKKLKSPLYEALNGEQQ